MNEEEVIVDGDKGIVCHKIPRQLCKKLTILGAIGLHDKMDLLNSARPIASIQSVDKPLPAGIDSSISVCDCLIRIRICRQLM